jgi:zinc/manganese transport system substrate-binding protein
MISAPMIRTDSRFPLLAVVLAVCATPVLAARPLVVASNTILADMTARVAGDAAEIRCLVPQGVDLHGFEPRPSDVAALSRAALVVANGADFEPWLDKLVESSGYRGPVVHAASDCPLIERGADPGPEHGHGHPIDREHEHDHGGVLDPHAWQDVTNGIRYVTAICDALVAVDPKGEAGYRERARAYTAELESLDRHIRELFAGIAPDDRSIVTSHDSLGYFGRAYGLRIVPLRGLDSRQEPDARAIAALVDELRAQKVRAIFVEAVSNPKMLQQLARDTGVSLGGELYTDSVGPAGSPAATYAGMMRENARRIAAALAPR